MAKIKTTHLRKVERLGETGVLRVRIDHADLLAIDENGLTLVENRYSANVLNIIDLVAKASGTIYAQASSCALDGVANNGDIIAALTAGNKSKKLAGFLVATAGAALKLLALDGNGDAITAVKTSKLAKGKVKSVGISDGGTGFLIGQKIGYYTSASDFFFAKVKTVASGVITALEAIDCSPSFFFEEAQAAQLASLIPAHPAAERAVIQVATRDAETHVPLTFTIVGGGSKYVAGEQLSLSDGTGSCVVSATVNSGGAITGLTIVTATEAMTTGVNLTATGRTSTADNCTLTVADLVAESGYIDLTMAYNHI